MDILVPLVDVKQRGQLEAGGAGPRASAPDVRRWLRRPRVAGALYGVLAAEVAVLVGFALSFHAVDFVVYMWGGHAVAHGPWLYLGSSGRNSFSYPPLAAAAFLPVTLLPAAVAQVLWELASAAALVVAVRIVLKLAGWRPTRTETVAVAVVCMLLEPVYHTLFNGQVNLFLLAIVAVDVRRVAQGRKGGGLGIGIAAALKLTPGIFIVMFLLTRRTRAAVTAIVTFAACGLIGFGVAPAASWLYWTRCFYGSTRLYPAYLANQSVYGAAIRLFGGPSHVGLWYLPLTIVIAVAGLGSAAVFGRRHDWLRAMAVTGVTGLLISPVSWTHHWIDALPALVVLACDGRRARIGGACGLALFALALPWWTPHSLLHPAYGFHGLVTVAANSYLIAGLAFLAYMGWRAWQQRGGADGPGCLLDERVSVLSG